MGFGINLKVNCGIWFSFFNTYTYNFLIIFCIFIFLMFVYFKISNPINNLFFCHFSIHVKVKINIVISR